MTEYQEVRTALDKARELIDYWRVVGVMLKRGEIVKRLSWVGCFSFLALVFCDSLGATEEKKAIVTYQEKKAAPIEVSSPITLEFPTEILLEDKQVWKSKRMGMFVKLGGLESISDYICDNVTIKGLRIQVKPGPVLEGVELIELVYTAVVYTRPPKDRIAKVKIQIMNDFEELQVHTVNKSSSIQRKLLRNSEAPTLKINAEEKDVRSKSTSRVTSKADLARVLSMGNPRVKVTMNVYDN